jgi:hypothetical protein
LLPPPRHDVEHFDARREGHRGVDIALGDTDSEAVSDQHRADHQQEAEREHHDRRVPVDEVGERIGGHQHHQDREDHRDHHDRQMVGHADRRQDRIDREDDVEQQDLGDRRAEVHPRRLHRVEQIVVRRRIDIVVDFLGGLPDEEQAARDQDQVAPGELGLEAGAAMAVRAAADAEVEHRSGEADDPRNRRQQDEPHDEREADTQPARLLPLVLGELVQRIEMKMRLSMPSTTSITMSVTSAAHAAGSLNKAVNWSIAAP